ncbi:hypothetical protein B0H14DRAFT_2585494 [Mycena olivaceomarginata]|nr:hypothetical protein B0H14DRAFT_2585494 [Mycena olivaceomarginata]
MYCRASDVTENVDHREMRGRCCPMGRCRARGLVFHCPCPDASAAAGAGCVTGKSRGVLIFFLVGLIARWQRLRPALWVGVVAGDLGATLHFEARSMPGAGVLTCDMARRLQGERAPSHFLRVQRGAGVNQLYWPLVVHRTSLAYIALAAEHGHQWARIVTVANGLTAWRREFPETSQRRAGAGPPCEGRGNGSSAPPSTPVCACIHVCDFHLVLVILIPVPTMMRLPSARLLLVQESAVRMFGGARHNAFNESARLLGKPLRIVVGHHCIVVAKSGGSQCDAGNVADLLQVDGARRRARYLNGEGRNICTNRAIHDGERKSAVATYTAYTLTAVYTASPGNIAEVELYASD